MNDSKRDFDLVVWGATGFTGKLVVEYLLARYGVDQGLNWAIAGRSNSKLETLKTELGDTAGNLPVLTADSHDRPSLDTLSSQTRAVISTVGPYAKYGDDLVAACAGQGTHYCDLTGEVQWIRKMIDQHEAAAKQSGARIVHACGFDSIPFDLGVYYLQSEAMRRFGKPCKNVKMRVRAMKGGASGGTIASLLNVMQEARADREVARVLVHPYSLNPEHERSGPDQRDQTGPLYDKDMNAWTAPFVMSAVNTKVVRRSNALMDFEYGRDFSYQEAIYTGPGMGGYLRAMQITIGLGAVMLAGSVAVLRSTLANYFFPKPGDGPDENKRQAGFYKLIFLGETEQGQSLTVEVRGDRDPGYGSTSKIIAETGVCLALDDLGVEGGMWTPASAMGDALLKRLPANSGLSFDVEE